MSDTVPPLVSICIPSYNNADFIEETIESVLQQSYPNLELVITDDASTDDTVIRIQHIIKQCPIPVTLELTKKNGGIASNWNHCLSLAQGQYIKLLPADDILLPNCIAEQVHQFKQYGDDIALVFCARKVVTRSGKALLTARFYGDQTINNKQLLIRCILSGTNVIGEPGAVLFTQRLAKKVGEFNGTKPYVIDLDYWARLLNHGDAVAIKKTLCTFRIDNNLSVRLGWRRYQEYALMIEQLSSTLQVNSLITIIGKLRALINEILRRGVHILYKIIG